MAALIRKLLAPCCLALQTCGAELTATSPWGGRTLRGLHGKALPEDDKWSACAPFVTLGASLTSGQILLLCQRVSAYMVETAGASSVC